MFKRVFVGVALGLLVFLSLITDKWVLVLLIGLLMTASVYEMNSAFRKAGYRTVLFAVYAYDLLVIPAVVFLRSSGVIALLMACTIMIMSTVVLSNRVSFTDGLASIFCLIYPLLPFTIIIIISQIEPDNLRRALLFQALICNSVTDTFALFFGMLFGKTKLNERLSPKKTVEGALGGVLGSVLFGMLFIFFGEQVFGVSFDWWHYIAIALLCSFGAQIGDLFASAVKRFAGIKDYGYIFPGHGGVMDRVDSVLFSMPIVFAYYLIFLI